MRLEVVEHLQLADGVDAGDATIGWTQKGGQPRSVFWKISGSVASRSWPR
jgi:hypothetical protein